VHNAVEALLSPLSSKSAEYRLETTAALQRIGASANVALPSALRKDPDTEVRRDATVTSGAPGGKGKPSSIISERVG
jgi:hypothetical protein